MAQSLQPYALNGGASMMLSVVEKLIYADAVVPAEPQNAAEPPMMENLKQLQAAGVVA
jgi:hypothetical protein